MDSKRQAILFAAPWWGGNHLAAWRDGDAPMDPTMDLRICKDFVQAAEGAKIHAVFLADHYAPFFPNSDDVYALSRTATATVFEPFTLMSAMAMCTERIGLAMTASTTYNEPYHVARTFASLDRISSGRAAWNIVTSFDRHEARNFGHDEHLGHALRYERGYEFVEVVKSLWDTFEDDAFRFDKQSGLYFDPEKLHVVDHEGKWFRVRGQLNVARPLQGYPVLVQAGQSVDGRAFACRVGEALFTQSVNTHKENYLDHAQALYAEIKTAAVDWGRSPDDVKILPALKLLVRESEAEALEKLDEFNELIDPKTGLSRLSGFMDHDLSLYPIDGPLPEVSLTDSGNHSLQRKIAEVARRENFTIRQAISWVMSLGMFAGSPQTIADRIEEWLSADACDGFTLTFADIPTSSTKFFELVVPELQRRGLFHRDYTARTLRENMGLPRPGNQHVDAGDGSLRVAEIAR